MTQPPDPPGASPALPRVSVVVSSDGRPESLARTLLGLHRLDYPAFEIIVVSGPSGDNRAALAVLPPGLAKTAICPARNLSQSRNLGIALAAGDIVAFIDDDAVPEPEWLRELVPAYDDPATGAAGGFVHDHTGTAYQARFVTTDRMGGARFDWPRAATELCFPYSASFPHLLGTNCSFRRTALLEVGGFDEEYEYYLDETDLCCRMVDGGWSVAQVAGARVHHKPQPSAVRQSFKVLTFWFPIIKNKLYYALINRHGHHAVTDVIREANALVEGLHHQLGTAIAAGHLADHDRDRFWREVVQAFETGLARGLSGQRRLMPSQAEPPAFVNAALPPPPGGRRRYCLLSQEYPPSRVGGVGRYIHQLARSLADLGHDPHVLTTGTGHDTVDFEDGVWVHRIVPRPHPAATTGAAGPVPPHVWSHAATLRDEVARLAERRPVAGIYAPVWDCEGAALLRQGTIPLVTGLQTMLRIWMQTNEARLADSRFVADFLTPMLALEQEVLRHSPVLHAISTAILHDIEGLYGLALADRAVVVPLGLEDYRTLPATPAPAKLPGITHRILFVGRLEARKGIDVLLEAALPVLARFPTAQLDIVGNATLPGPGGPPYRAAFLADPRTAAIRPRVVFHGEVDDAALRGFYAACDLFVAPSRFESFGLVFVEAMMFAKPTIGCRIGGMPEVIAEGETGLLAEPGNPAALADALTRLLADDALRTAMGRAGRARYDRLFTPRRMAEGVVAAFSPGAFSQAALPTAATTLHRSAA